MTRLFRHIVSQMLANRELERIKRKIKRDAKEFFEYANSGTPDSFFLLVRQYNSMKTNQLESEMRCRK